MKNIRVGVIGLGGVGKKLLEQFINHKYVKVQKICDSNIEIASETSKEFGNISWTNSYLDVVFDEEIDLVYVAVPPKFHSEIVLEAIKRGKHIFCEKPLANTLEEAKKMYKAAKEAGIIHAMNFPTPYRPAFKVFNERVKANELGIIKRIEVTACFQQWPRVWQQNKWIATREQGGFTREVIPHYIQMIQNLFGKLHVLSSIISYPADDDKSEHSLVATLKLKDGTLVLFNCFSDVAMVENIRFTVYGSEGTISLVDWEKLEYGVKDQQIRELQLESKNHLNELINQLVLKCNKENAELFTFKEGIEVQEILEKLLSGV